MRVDISGELSEICDHCKRSVFKEAAFSGDLTLKFNGHSLDFMGMEYERPAYSVPFVFCQGCALLIMQRQKGILVNG